MSIEARKEKAKAFVQSIARGRFDDDMLAPDFFAWTGISHKVPGDTYRERVAVIGQIFPDGLKLVIDSVTGESDRVSVQARGEGVLFNGERYTQSYHFLVEFDAEDRIRHAREYIDTHIVHQVLRPAMEDWNRLRQDPA